MEMCAAPEIRDVTCRANGALSFALANIDLSIANGLRRALIALVPTIAIERVRILKNTSDVEDETIVHALGLVPLVSNRAMDEDTMLPLPFPGDCGVCTGGEEGCEACGVRLTLHVVGPKDVTSNDIISDDPETAPFGCGGGKRPVALFRLKEKEEVHIVATAQKGRGATHAKWSPVCPATFVMEQQANGSPIFRFAVETTGALSPKQAVGAALREMELAAQRVLSQS